MITGFWKKLKKPIFALAPMANVTDSAFRQIIAHYGKPDVFWTEFVSADGLCSAGRVRLLLDLQFSKKEHPIVAQIFGANPQNFYKAAQIIADLGFDGIDINLGCPDRAIVKQGAGAALIKNPALAKEIILATKKGAGKLPVSVKTRIGFDRNILDSWLPVLIEAGPSAITIHARTKKQMSLVPADWETVRQAVKIVRSYPKAKQPLILGNGDVVSREDGLRKIAETGADGVMIGRGIFGNPWVFKSGAHAISQKEKFKALLEHTKLFEKLYYGKKDFDVMKKHFKAYVTGFDGARELRMKLMECDNFKGVRKSIKEYQKNTPT